MEDFSKIPWFSLILSLVYKQNSSLDKDFLEEAIFEISRKKPASNMTPKTFLFSIKQESFLETFNSILS